MKLENFKKEIQNIKLTPEEKGEILERVLNSPTPSPYAPKRTRRIERIQKSWWKTLPKPLLYVGVCLFVVLIGGSGMSYAALNSVPGDRLYQVKIKLTEPVLDALNFTPKSRAKWEAEKAIRRLDEAGKLVEKNNLTEKHRVEIEKNFNKSVEKFKKEVKEAQKDKEGKADDLEINFSQSLNEQADRLKKENKHEDKKQEEEINQLENTVREKIKEHSSKKINKMLEL